MCVLIIKNWTIFPKDVDKDLTKPLIFQSEENGDNITFTHSLYQLKKRSKGELNILQTFITTHWCDYSVFSLAN